MLSIIFSNQYHKLLDRLLAATAKPAESPFAATNIVIPSAAIRRSVELAMADHNGICANIHFSYLGQWVWQQLGAVMATESHSPFDPAPLVWRVLKILGNKTFTQAHPRLHAYVDHADGLMRYELAAKLASLIEQTMIYRPELVDAWSTNKFICVPGGTRSTAKDHQWQAELWRRILQEVGGDRHLPALLRKLDAAPPPPLQTTHIFCPSAIAPLYIETLNRFGKWMDLRLYVLNPCREYWFDIIDRKRLDYLAAKEQSDYHETGNQLLAAWGKQTQSMIDLLFDQTTLVCEERHEFVSNASQGKQSLLARVQDAILDCHDLPPASISLTPDDRSIEIHVSHSLMREIEILQDQLLAMFASDASLNPDEVLVVTPDLQTAAPYIETVFGTTTGKRRIPYTVTGMGNTRINPVARALIDLLTLATSRITASATQQLLQQTVVAEAFDLSTNDLTSIHHWMANAGIRWGLDGDHKLQFGLPENNRYTFSDGLEKLFLGYALPDHIDMPFSGHLATGQIEGSEALALGRFRQFIMQLVSLQRELAQGMPPPAWQDFLFKTLEAFIKTSGNTLDDAREVRAQIGELCNHMLHGGHDSTIASAVVLHALKCTLDDPARGGVPTGNVTFTSMSSLRHLPYRVICMIGMNDGSFPSRETPAEFDLIAVAPRRGDRQRRGDERNMFLDLMLAATDRLYISYSGRNIQDNAELPPSVLVSDLLDYLVTAVENDHARKRLLIEHPLQPFSFDYFLQKSDPRIASSNTEYFRAIQQNIKAPASALETPAADDMSEDAETKEAEQLFFSQLLPPPDASWRQLTLEQLIRFFRNPSRYLLRHRLGIQFPEAHEELHDDEPFLPDWDEKNSLSERLLPMFFRHEDLAAIRASAYAGTEYPPGEMGAALLERELQAMANFATKLSVDLDTAQLPPQTHTFACTIDGEDWVLNHNFNQLRAQGLVLHRFDEMRAVDYLTAWITHLFLNAYAPANAVHQTIWYSRNGSVRLAPVSDANLQLQTLLSMYRSGLQKPLPFYPKSAWEFVSTGFNLAKAENRWHGGLSEERGEKQNPAYRLALRGQENSLDDAFEHCARAVFEPMMHHISNPGQP